jgi:hypothetical protein
MRGACPNYRTYLFEPDALTAIQIQQNGGSLNALDLSRFTRLMIRRVEGLLDRFLTFQDGAFEVDEIIHSWTLLARDRKILEGWVLTFRRRASDLIEVRGQLLRLADTIEKELTKARERYMTAITADTQAQCVSIYQRVVSIRENRTTTKRHELLELKEIETEIEGMVSRILHITPDELSDMKGDAWAISMRVKILACKYIILVSDEGYNFSPTSQGNGEAEESNLDSEIQDTLAEMDRYVDHDNFNVLGA